MICGGGSGVMAAVAAGSPDLSVRLVTNMGEARNAIIVWSADAVIVVGGSWGALSELALAKRRGGVPVTSLGVGRSSTKMVGRCPALTSRRRRKKPLPWRRKTPTDLHLTGLMSCEGPVDRQAPGRRRRVWRGRPGRRGSRGRSGGRWIAAKVAVERGRWGCRLRWSAAARRVRRRVLDAVVQTWRAWDLICTWGR